MKRKRAALTILPLHAARCTPVELGKGAAGGNPALPRLQDALRAMANEGQLTTAAIIDALQSRAVAVDAELPMTVVRAMTNFLTAWMKFIGALDNGAGTTAAVAAAMADAGRSEATHIYGSIGHESGWVELQFGDFVAASSFMVGDKAEWRYDADNVSIARIWLHRGYTEP